jgi:hypothetical protein
MNTYIIELNKLENKPVLNEVIEGRTATEALHNRFLVPLRKIYNKDSEIADLVIVRGSIRENGKIKYYGRATRQFYVVDKEAI